MRLIFVAFNLVEDVVECRDNGFRKKFSGAVRCANGNRDFVRFLLNFGGLKIFIPFIVNLAHYLSKTKKSSLFDFKQKSVTSQNTLNSSLRAI